MLVKTKLLSWRIARDQYIFELNSSGGVLTTVQASSVPGSKLGKVVYSCDTKINIAFWFAVKLSLKFARQS